MTKLVGTEIAECLTHIQAGLALAPEGLTRAFALVALARLETLIRTGHRAADHAPKTRRSRKATPEPTAPAGS